MPYFTENDEKIARSVLFSICLTDAFENGLNRTNVSLKPEDFRFSRFVKRPKYYIDSDFSFAYDNMFLYSLDVLCDIMGVNPLSDVDIRNQYLVENRDLLLLPDMRKYKTPAQAFGGDYENIIRPVLVMMRGEELPYGL